MTRQRKLLLVAAAGVAAVLASRMLLRRSRRFSFEGRTAFVTGGSRGLGLELARQLVDAGARVAICARTQADLEHAERELRRRGGTVCPSLVRTGSTRNALFKGQHRKEHAWFSVAGSLPLVAMGAEQAAAQILRACRDGEREVVLRNPLNVAVALQEFFPGTTQSLLGLVARAMPRMGDAAAQRNNEMRRRPQESGLSLEEPRDAGKRTLG
jgi:short-subunit dehydrogenase